MKIALYIEDGYEQIVLTPQTDTERNLLGKLEKGRVLSVKTGGFYHCQGGWVRQHESEESVMLVLTPPSEAGQ